MKEHNITLPHAVKLVSYGGQLSSRQFIEDNEKLLKGLHVVGF